MLSAKMPDKNRVVNRYCMILKGSKSLYVFISFSASQSQTVKDMDRGVLTVELKGVDDHPTPSRQRHALPRSDGGCIRALPAELVPLSARRPRPPTPQAIRP